MKAYLVVCALALHAGAALAQGELGINVYGLSYHLEDTPKDNGVNPGLGLRWRAPAGDPRFDWIAEAGAYYDSGRNTALFAGGGIYWHLNERLHVGAIAALGQSDSYNGGDPFVAPIPFLAWDWRSLTFNFAYFPKIGNTIDSHTLAFWLTFWPRRAN